MRPFRVLQHGILWVYLLVTSGAFVLTMSKYEPPFPRTLVHWSYGMMAPYQGDTSWNADFVYEGQLPDGTWEKINLDHYLPYEFGERNVRKFLRIYRGLGPAGHRRKFREYATLLRDHEKAAGRVYGSIRVYFDTWPRSPAGYSFLYLPAFTTRELITVLP
jgi:hypothetical protein